MNEHPDSSTVPAVTARTPFRPRFQVRLWQFLLLPFLVAGLHWLGTAVRPPSERYEYCRECGIHQITTAHRLFGLVPLFASARLERTLFSRVLEELRGSSCSAHRWEGNVWEDPLGRVETDEVAYRLMHALATKWPEDTRVLLVHQLEQRIASGRLVGIATLTDGRCVRITSTDLRPWDFAGVLDNFQASGKLPENFLDLFRTVDHKPLFDITSWAAIRKSLTSDHR